MDKKIELKQGTIDYRDDGEGETLVFVHGLLVDGRLWRKVTPLLTGRSARTALRYGRALTALRAASRT
jgi:pimeloyl-ACP methyl ester carboxylesterase